MAIGGELLSACFDASPDAVLAVAEDGSVVAVNAAVTEVLGYPAEELLGRSVDELVPERFVSGHPGHRSAFLAHPARRMMGAGRELWARRRDGVEIPVDISLNLVEVDGEPLVLVALRDMTERHRVLAATQAAERRFELVFDNAPAGAAVLGADGEVQRANRALCRLLEAAVDDVVGHPISAWVVEAERRRVDQVIAGVCETEGDQVHLEVRVVVTSGAERRAVLTAASVRDDVGMLVVATFEDVTEQRQAEHELTFLATHDPLTGLPNRTMLEERIRLAEARARRSGQCFGVLFVDLDGFKEANDRLGHRAGDDVLVQIAQRLTAAVRPGDTVARHGGDEFVICCDEVGADDARATEVLDALAARILDAVRRPLEVDGGRFELSACIGIELGRPSEAAEPGERIAAADAAMYEAKRTGAGQVNYTT